MKLEYFMGEKDLAQVRLSPRELGALTAAAAILERLRELREDADDDLTTDIALAAHVCHELVAVDVIANP